MIEEILSAVGIPFRQTRFLYPQSGDYIVWNDSTETDGGDDKILLYHHEVTVELYTAAPSPGIEAALEASIAAHGLHFTKEEAFWLQPEQRYQTVYEFDFYEKKEC